MISVDENFTGHHLFPLSCAPSPKLQLVEVKASMIVVKSQPCSSKVSAASSRGDVGPGFRQRSSTVASAPSHPYAVVRLLRLARPLGSASEMTYIVSSGALNSIHSLTLSLVLSAPFALHSLVVNFVSTDHQLLTKTVCFLLVYVNHAIVL